MTDAATTPAADPAPAEESIEQIASRLFVEDAPVGPAAVAEPAPEPAKDPIAEKASARILANLAADKRAARIRAEVAAQQAEIAKSRAEVEDLAKAAEALKAAKGSPSKALELLGMSPKEFLESLATEHEPEAVAKRAVEGTLTEVQKLQARIDAMEKADRDRQQQLRHRELAQAEQVEGAAFVEYIADNAAKYPSLVEAMDPNEIVQAGFALLHEVIGKDARGKEVTRLAAWMAEHDGEPPTNDDIAEALEERAAPRAKLRSEWRTRIGKNAPPASTATPPVDERATQMDRGPSPRTLTSRAASEKAASPPQWTQEWADQESLRIINASLKTG